MAGNQRLTDRRHRFFREITQRFAYAAGRQTHNVPIGPITQVKEVLFVGTSANRGGIPYVQRDAWVAPDAHSHADDG